MAIITWANRVVDATPTAENAEHVIKSPDALVPTKVTFSTVMATDQRGKEVVALGLENHF